MATVPAKATGNPWDYRAGNQPFHVESVTYDGVADVLNAEVGNGRARWGSDTFELAATSGLTTASSDAPVTPSATYYVTVAHNGGTPQLQVTTTAPAASDVLLATVTTASDSTVASVTDERGLGLTGHGTLTDDGTAAAPSRSYASDPDTGSYLHAADTIGWATGGTGRLTLGNDYLAPLADNATRLGGSGLRFSNVYSHAGSFAGTLDAAAITVDNLTLSGNTVTAGGGFDLRLDGADDLVFLTQGTLRGLYDVSRTQWRWWAGTEEVMRLSTSGLHMVNGNTIVAEAGSAAVPGVRFAANGDSGLFYDGSITNGIDGVCLSINGIRGFGLSMVGYETRWYATESNDYIQHSRDVETWSFMTQGVSVLNLNHSGSYFSTELTVEGRLRVKADGGRTNPAIKFVDTDSGFFHDSSLNRVATTVDLGSSSSYYSSTLTTGGGFYPGRDAVMQLGNGTFRWEGVWSVDTTINSSDLRGKRDVQSSDLGLAFVRAVEPIRFRREGRVRPHYGFGAQQVKAALDDLGHDDFAGFIDPAVDAPDPDKWPEAYDADGNLKATLGLRYGEFIGPAYQAIRELADEVDELRDEVARLTPGV